MDALGLLILSFTRGSKIQGVSMVPARTWSLVLAGALP